MPKIPGVKLIPAPNGSVRSGFVRWSDLEEQIANMKKEIMDELRVSSEKLDLKSNGNGASINGDGNGTSSNGVGVVVKDAPKMETSIPLSQDPTMNKEQVRVSWNDMRMTHILQNHDNVMMNQAIMETTDVAADQWGFRGTCWDAAAFVGDKNMMLRGEGVVVVLLCVLSLIVQSLFILIVFLSLTGSPLDQDKIDGFHLWRTNVGQDITHINPLTLESLSSRVCRDDSSLHLADRQVSIIKEIDDYLDNNAPFNGPMMCLLAMLTWTLTVCKELHVLKDMWSALCSIPVSDETVFDFVKGKLNLRKIHRGRITWIAFISVFRVSIALSLLFAGLMFLARTYSIEDILLNAIALEFVLNVDELLYHALSPVKTKKLLLLMKPISIPRGKRSWAGIDVDVPVTLAFACGTLGLMFGLRLMAEIQNMNDAKSELCDGFTDFQYGASEWSATMWQSEPSSVEEKEKKFFASNRYKIIRGAIDKGGDEANWKADPLLEDHLAPALTGPGWSVVNFARKPQLFYQEDFNDGCTDIFGPDSGPDSNPIYNVLLDSLRDSMHNYTVTLCSQVGHYCNTYANPGPQVRWLCPITCGCTQPGSSLALSEVAEGCPNKCKRRPDMMKQYLDRTCTQPSNNLLIADPIWKQYGVNYATIGATWGEKRELYFGFIAQLFLAQGCDAIINAPKPIEGQDMCEIPPMKTLAFWCPLHCGCNTTAAPAQCPQTCAVGNPIPIGTQTPSDLASLYVRNPP